MRGQQTNFIDRINAALRINIKGADGVNFVTKQINPVGYGTAHRK